MSLNLDDVAEFTWNFGQLFLLQVDDVNGSKYYVWSCPDYKGDNTIRPFIGDPRNFTQPGFCGRHKGRHRIRDYCGNDAVFVGC